MAVHNTSEPLLPVDDPVALIRSRIKEKRIFEARFLCRQLVDEMGPEEKTALERELNGMLTQVGHLRQQARSFLDEGRHDRAVALYNEMETIAIDVPGVAEEKRALAETEALAAKIGAKGTVSNPPPPTAGPAVEEDTTAEAPGPINEPEPVPLEQPAASQRRWPSSRIVLPVAAVILLILLALLWRAWTDQNSSPPAPPPTAQQIRIQPLAEPVDAPTPPQDSSPPLPEGSEQVPATDEPAPAEPANPPPPDQEPTVSPADDTAVPPSLHLGTLQVAPSGDK